MENKKHTRFDLQKMKESGQPAVWITDGQLMIFSDVLVIFQAFTPKFVKKY